MTEPDVDAGYPAPPEPVSSTRVGSTDPGSSASDAALARYRRANRRRSTVYYAVLVAVLVALGVVVAVAWEHGEVAHVSLHTGQAPPDLAVQPPSPSQQLAWRTADRLAIGQPQWGGTVITYSAHTVTGRNARSGQPVWTYTRTDRSVCTAVQAGGTTVAVYAFNGNCDEWSAFHSATGQRRWTRTLDMDGMPLDGRPAFQVTPFTVLAYSPAVIYAIDPISGYNRWTYQRFGCRIEHVVLGSAGALISQNCSAQVKCAGVKYCGRGPQLLLRDGSAGRGDTSKPNADQIKWLRLGNGDVPVAADGLLGTVDPTGRRLTQLDAGSGAPRGTITLHPRTAGLGAITAYETTSDELLWLSGVTYAIAPGASTPDWTVVAPTAPTLEPGPQDQTPSLSTARITLARPGGVALLDGVDGRITHTFALPVPAGATAYSLGTGFLLGAPSGTVAYR